MSDLLEKETYNFLKTNEHLGRHIILLGLSGSYAYGTNNSQSDIDLRGVTLNRPSDLIGLTTFEQYTDENTDTCIYAFNKVIKLLLNCNPNIIELLGLKPEHYLYIHPIGEELLENRHLFLSQRAIHSFGGYASSQLRRLQNALARDNYPQVEKEKHILNSINNAIYDFNGRYADFENGSIELSITESRNPALEQEIVVDVNLNKYPLRDYKNIWSEMSDIIKNYEKLGKRNTKKDDNHLNKHAMHLIRLFMMAIDILEKGEINTFRQNEQTLLQTIRTGGFQTADGTFDKNFFKLLDEYEQKLAHAAKNTKLPEQPDYEKIEKFVMNINERVIRHDF